MNTRIKLGDHVFILSSFQWNDANFIQVDFEHADGTPSMQMIEELTTDELVQLRDAIDSHLDWKSANG